VRERRGLQRRGVQRVVPSRSRELPWRVRRSRDEPDLLRRDIRLWSRRRHCGEHVHGRPSLQRQDVQPHMPGGPHELQRDVHRPKHQREILRRDGWMRRRCWSSRESMCERPGLQRRNMQPHMPVGPRELQRHMHRSEHEPELLRSEHRLRARWWKCGQRMRERPGLQRRVVQLVVPIGLRDLQRRVRRPWIEPRVLRRDDRLRNGRRNCGIGLRFWRDLRVGEMRGVMCIASHRLQQRLRESANGSRLLRRDDGLRDHRRRRGRCGKPGHCMRRRANLFERKVRGHMPWLARSMWNDMHRPDERHDLLRSDRGVRRILRWKRRRIMHVSPVLQRRIMRLQERRDGVWSNVHHPSNRHEPLRQLRERMLGDADLHLWIVHMPERQERMRIALHDVVDRYQQLRIVRQRVRLGPVLQRRQLPMLQRRDRVRNDLHQHVERLVPLRLVRQLVLERRFLLVGFMHVLVPGRLLRSIL
jgi:hypothetical protein